MAGARPLLLAKDLTVAGDTFTFSTPWRNFPAVYKDADLVVACRVVLGATLSIALMTSYDSDQETQLGTAVTVNASGNFFLNVTANVGPLVRLRIARGVTPVQCIISAWLTPKKA